MFGQAKVAPIRPTSILDYNWFEGPSFLKTEPNNTPTINASVPLTMDEISIDENDPEVKVNAYATSSIEESALNAKRFERFSDWTILQRAIPYLVGKIRSQKAKKVMRGPEQGRKVKDECQHSTVKESNKAAKPVIIKKV